MQTKVNFDGNKPETITFPVLIFMGNKWFSDLLIFDLVKMYQPNITNVE